ncbi:hypothetical protein IW00_05430 [Pectobacterium brasiliense]|nr:hypothetical protein IW00_05430 [Pectobacterium brasiliense]
MTSVSCGHVASRIACGNGRTHITVRSQHGTGNIHAPGLAIGIHRRLIGLDAHFDGNRIARFDFIADLTGDRYGLTGLGRINHVIGRDVIN